MMRFLITADWQISPNPRDSYRWTNLIQIAGLIEKYKATALLILGDLTEEKNCHSDVLVNELTELLYLFSCMCPVYILQGNHDAVDFIHPAYFHFLHNIQNIHWISCPTRKLGCLFLPFTHTPEKDWTTNLFEPKPDWIFAHQTFANAVTEGGFQLRGIPLDLLPAGSRVISGDIHKPQELTDGQRTVTYVGSPYLVDFGDDFEPRVLIVNDNSMCSIPMTGPQKRLLDLGVGNDPPWPNPGDIIKVRYQLNAHEREHWPEIKARIRKELEARGCEVFVIQPIAPPSAPLSARTSRRPRSDEQIMRDFAKRQKVPDPTLGVGLEIVKAT